MSHSTNLNEAIDGIVMQMTYWPQRASVKQETCDDEGALAGRVEHMMSSSSDSNPETASMSTSPLSSNLRRLIFLVEPQNSVLSHLEEYPTHLYRQPPFPNALCLQIIATCRVVDQREFIVDRQHLTDLWNNTAYLSINFSRRRD